MSAIPSNKQLSARCHKALARYSTDDEPSTSLVDFLADARHWCDQSGEDYAELDRRAYQHYLAEIHNL
jgi:hypothetical protein